MGGEEDSGCYECLVLVWTSKALLGGEEDSMDLTMNAWSWFGQVSKALLRGDEDSIVVIISAWSRS